jgi:hypothetical protein
MPPDHREEYPRPDAPVVLGLPPGQRHRWPSWLAPALAAVAVGAIGVGVAVAAAFGRSHQHHATLPPPVTTQATMPTSPARWPHPSPSIAPATRHQSLPPPSTPTSGSYHSERPTPTATRSPIVGISTPGPVHGTKPGRSPAPSTPASPHPYTEEAYNKHGVPTFGDYKDASDPGDTIAFGLDVQVSCKIYDSSIPSVDPGGYWYRIASPPWDNAYYAAANTFLNGDPPGGPYTHNYDSSVPDC